MSIEAILLIVLGVLVVALGGYTVSLYNSLVTVRNNVEKAWETIDIVLQQRNDELPKLIDACKAYMQHEKGLLEQITELRTGYASTRGMQDKIRLANELNTSLGKLRMVWEQYPDLKAVQSFLQVQGRVSAIESKIADYREMFNDTVNIYNIQIERLPDFLLARALSYQRHAFLEVPEAKKADVKMQFT